MLKEICTFVYDEIKVFSSPVLCQLRHWRGKFPAWLAQMPNMPRSVPQTPMNYHLRMYVTVIKNSACNELSSQVIYALFFLSYKNETFY